MWHELVGIWRNRRVLHYFYNKEIKVTYRNKMLGHVWALLEPLMIMVVLYFVFQDLRHSTKSVSLYLFAGLIGWDFFSKTVSGCALCIRKYRNIIHKYPLPMSLYPLTMYLIRVNDFAWGVAAFIVMFLTLNGFWHLGLKFFASWHMLLFPLWFIGFSAITIGVGLIFARLGVLFGDMENVATVVLRAGFFLNPIFIEIPTLPEKYHRIYLLADPLAGYLLYLRLILPGGEALLGGYVIPIAHYPLILAAWSAGILLLGGWLFSRGSRHFAKYL